MSQRESQFHLHMGLDPTVVGCLQSRIDELNVQIANQDEELEVLRKADTKVPISPLPPLLAGAALGASAGLLAGLAQSPTVGGLTVAVIGLGSSAIGLRGPANARASAFHFLTAFALLLLLVVPIGIYVRAHGTLSPSPNDMVERFTSAHFDRLAAQQLAIAALGYSSTTSVPDTDIKDLDSNPVGEPDSDLGGLALTNVLKEPSSTDTVLFHATAMECNELINKFRRHEVPVATTIQHMNSLGGDWHALVESYREPIRQSVQRFCDTRPGNSQ